MIKKNIEKVKERIKQACERCGRSESEITLIAVSKTKPFSMIQEAYDAGMREFGENKPQTPMKWGFEALWQRKNTVKLHIKQRNMTQMYC